MLQYSTISRIFKDQTYQYTSVEVNNIRHINLVCMHNNHAWCFASDRCDRVDTHVLNLRPDEEEDRNRRRSSFKQQEVTTSHALSTTGRLHMNWMNRGWTELPSSSREIRYPVIYEITLRVGRAGLLRWHVVVLQMMTHPFFRFLCLSFFYLHIANCSILQLWV